MKYLTAIAITLLALSTTRAQEDEAARSATTRIRLESHVGLALGPQTNFDVDNLGLSVDRNENLLVALGFEVLMHENASLGMRLEYGAMDYLDERSIHAIDFSVVPRFRLPVARRSAVYAALPLGWTAFVSHDLGDELFAGWNISPRVGGELFFSESVGSYVELGYAVRVPHDEKFSFDLSFSEFVAAIGLKYAF